MSNKGGWFGTSWGAPKQITPEEQARINAAHLEELQTQFDGKSAMIGQLTENLKRFHAETEKAKQRKDMARASEYRIQRDNVMNSIRALEKARNTLAGQIATLSNVTNNVQTMRNNVALHSVIKDSNTVTTQFAQQLDPDDVHDTMHDAEEHQEQADEVSRILSGEAMQPVMEPEEKDAECARYLGLDMGETVSVQYDVQEAQARAELERKEEEHARLLASLPSPAQRQAPAAVSSSSASRYRAPAERERK